jgi:hypothetical protein
MLTSQYFHPQLDNSHDRLKAHGPVIQFVVMQDVLTSNFEDPRVMTQNKIKKRINML